MFPNEGRPGLKLAEDPFFQYIKNNRLIREVLIKPGEEFAPEKIVLLALRQNIGVDNAASIKPKILRDPSELPFEEIYRYGLNYQESTVTIRPRLAT